MRRNTAELVGASSAALLATLAYLAWREVGARWAGTWPGHLLGIAGLALMLWAGFGYSWRKRHPASGDVAMKVAMQSHVVAGLVGPYLVILHSGLAFRGLAGVLTLVMVLVVASGVVGRAIYSALPRDVVAADPVRAAMLDADLARLEIEHAELLRQGDPDPAARQRLRRAMTALHHEEELLRSEWRQTGGTMNWRRFFSIWWFLHVPVSAALWVLAGVHVVASLYYATFGR
jgi:hypothetical protein